MCFILMVIKMRTFHIKLWHGQIKTPTEMKVASSRPECVCCICRFGAKFNDSLKGTPDTRTSCFVTIKYVSFAQWQLAAAATKQAEYSARPSKVSNATRQAIECAQTHTTKLEIIAARTKPTIAINYPKERTPNA